MSEPFIRVRNAYFVPIRRQRLAFAVLVRRALENLAPWGEDDVIAVPVPPSISPSLAKEIARDIDTTPFPVKLVVSRWTDSNDREVFPVTPADGVVEAIRFAEERGILWEGIDREIAPGNLIERTCMPIPLAAEDDLVLRSGIRRYLQICAPELSVHPVRFDPIDALREVHLAEQIQRLAPLHRRVLVVCDAVNFEGIRRHIGTPSRGLSEGQVGGPETVVTRVVDPTLPVMLRYLDDFPRLTEQFERMRAKGEAASFQKVPALLQVLYDIGLQTGDGFRSIRRVETFTSYLRSILGSSGRTIPEPAEVAEAFQGCFGAGNGRRMVHEIARYGESVDVERIGGTRAATTTDYALKDRRSEAPFVARTCSDTGSFYTVRPRPPKWGKNDSDNSQSLAIESRNWKQLRGKALALFQRNQDRHRVERFRGSLEQGVDARRTLRSFLSASPGTWISRRQRDITPRDLQHEPIVWICEVASKRKTWMTSGRLSCCCFGEKTKFCQSSRYLGNETDVFRSQDGSIRFTSSDVLGRLHFVDDDLQGVEATLRRELRGRIPIHRDMAPVGEGTEGCVLLNLHEDAESGMPWWEILILSALQYAKLHVLCVVPDGFRASPTLLATAKSLRKEILFLRIHQFSKTERETIGKSYSVYVPSGSTEDPAFNDRIRRCITDLGIW